MANPTGVSRNRIRLLSTILLLMLGVDILKWMYQAYVHVFWFELGILATPVIWVPESAGMLMAELLIVCGLMVAILLTTVFDPSNTRKV